MASTVGHGLCGIACLLGAMAMRPPGTVRLSWKSAGLFAVLANVPDADMLFGLIVASNAYAFHQGPSHSLLFAAGVGILGGIALRNDQGLWTATGACFAASVSHAVIDVLSGPMPGFNPSPGLALFWPFSSEMVSVPVTLFHGIHHGGVEQLASLHNAKAVLHEIAVFLPVIAVLLFWVAITRRIRLPCRRTD